MKLVFVTNFFNHHQMELANELYEKLNGEFYFVETESMPEERKKLGYHIKKYPPYLISAYLSDENARNSIKIINEADVVVMGSAPELFIKERISLNKLLIRYAERPLKLGNEFFKYPVRLVRWHKRNPKNKPIYLLCASAFTSLDYSKFGLFEKKMFKWGYFPEKKTYSDIEYLIEKKKKNRILWCGRFLEWKNPRMAIDIAKRLKLSGYDFEMLLIGTGALYEQINSMIKKYDLNERVKCLGSMKPEEVRRYMESSGIFLFTSNKREGWGAVLNEAMNSGCSVVASHEIGAVPYLIQNAKNGFVYESGNVDMLFEKVKILLDDSNVQKVMGRKAYETIVNEWNAEVAASRLILLAEKLLCNEEPNGLFESGLCSTAEVLNDKWVQR